MKKQRVGDLLNHTLLFCDKKGAVFFTASM